MFLIRSSWVLPFVVTEILPFAFPKIWFSNLYKIHGNTVFIKGVLSFTHTINTGSAFSFLAGKKWAQTFFKVLTCFALLAFIGGYIYALKSRYKTLSVSIILIFSGTVGNFIDRLLYSGVTDFIKFDFINFPIFNFADILLTCGVIVFIFHFFFLDENAIFRKTEKNSEAK